MLPFPTQDAITAEYLALAVAIDPTDDISQYTDYNNKGQVIGGVVGGVYQDAFNAFNNTLPQYADSQGINLGLANAGVPITYPAYPAILTLTADGTISGKTYNVPLGTSLTAPNGSIYSVISSTNSNLVNVIITPSDTTLYAIGIATGQNTTQANSTVLTASPPIVSTDGTSNISTFTVTANTDGANQETLAHATTRLIEVRQTPLCGTRTTDFYNLLAPNESNSVTDAIILINNQLTYTDTQYNVGAYVISETPINDYILDQGLLYSTTEIVYNRSASSDAITNSQAILTNQDLMGVFPIVSTVATQQITALTGTPDPFFKIIVTLQNAYTLSTQVTLVDGTFTIGQLVQREARRAICSQPYGATLSADPTTGAFTTSTFPISAIEQQLDLALGTPTTVGSIGSYLIDRTVYTWNGSAYVYQPTLTLALELPVAPTDDLGWIYDVSTTVGQIYANILVTLS